MVLGEERQSPSNIRNNSAWQPLQPFLKWPGGKRWLIDNYNALLPRTITGRYIEAFLGGGAIFFYLRPQCAILSDVNSDLIETYEAVRSQHDQVVNRLLVYHHQHQQAPETYYSVRAQVPETLVERAARFIYLNRTCFNGIYRVNRAGKFNVPRGSKTKVILPDDDWQSWSAALQGAKLLASDFQSVVDQAEKGDFVFADPPYTIHHNMNGFIKYNEVLFSWDDQLRLAESLERARRRGARILMTNANHESVRTLYGRGFKKRVVTRFSSVSAHASGRSSFEELVISA